MASWRQPLEQLDAELIDAHRNDKDEPDAAVLERLVHEAVHLLIAGKTPGWPLPAPRDIDAIAQARPQPGRDEMRVSAATWMVVHPFVRDPEACQSYILTEGLGNVQIDRELATRQFHRFLTTQRCDAIARKAYRWACRVGLVTVRLEEAP